MQITIWEPCKAPQKTNPTSTKPPPKPETKDLQTITKPSSRPPLLCFWALPGPTKCWGPCIQGPQYQPNGTPGALQRGTQNLRCPPPPVGTSVRPAFDRFVWFWGPCKAPKTCFWGLLGPCKAPGGLFGGFGGLARPPKPSNIPLGPETNTVRGGALQGLGLKTKTKPQNLPR